ncbi:hypothetical protein ACQP00_40615 [Dactylosporangium sp. CS-047395]|uniref:hypothetical protein n=1 Tax=Dactylosporangium sp. CS-047395 TaxID=3239936 RepID=UPI003D90BDB6
MVTVHLRGMTATLDGITITIDAANPNARDLEALARALWAARTRETLRHAGLTREPRPIGWRAEEYVRRRAAIVACGQSGTVKIQVTGMRQWRVEINGATGSDVEQAARHLIQDQEQQIRALKRELWGRPRPSPCRR